MRGIRLATAALFVVLHGCGGGDDGVNQCAVNGTASTSPDSVQCVEGELTITSTSSSPLGWTNLQGTAFVTQGASCELKPILNDRGGVIYFRCDCTDDGSGRVTWTNATTGQSGTGRYNIYGGNVWSEGCFPREVRWELNDSIPLVPGENDITITMRDSKTIGSASTTVTRD